MVEENRRDQDLLAAARAVDGAAFGVFYRRHRAVVLTFLARRTRNPETAADLLAETFAAALVAVRDDGRPLPNEPLPWLMTIARNKLTDSLRRGQVERAARQQLGLAALRIDDDDLDRIEELIDRTDLATTLAEQLPEDQLRALRARILDERDYSEIAGALRCSEAVVRKRVSRALRTLREAMEGT